MKKWYFQIITNVSLVSLLVEGRGPHHPTASHHHYHPQPSVHKKLLKEEQVLHDERHIVEDLGEWAKDAHLTNEELEFRYFKVHDLDNNTKLDGLEIYQAIMHSMDTPTLPTNSDEETWTDQENTIVQLIDQILEEDDLNNDGYLSYIEYVIGRQKV